MKIAAIVENRLADYVIPRRHLGRRDHQLKKIAILAKVYLRADHAT